MSKLTSIFRLLRKNTIFPFSFTEEDFLSRVMMFTFLFTSHFSLSLSTIKRFNSNVCLPFNYQFIKYSVFTFKENYWEVDESKIHYQKEIFFCRTVLVVQVPCCVVNAFIWVLSRKWKNLLTQWRHAMISMIN